MWRVRIVDYGDNFLNQWLKGWGTSKIGWYLHKIGSFPEFNGKSSILFYRDELGGAAIFSSRFLFSPVVRALKIKIVRH